MGRFANFDQIIFPMLALIVVLGVVTWLIGGGRGQGPGKSFTKGYKAPRAQDSGRKFAKKLLKAEEGQRGRGRRKG